MYDKILSSINTLLELCDEEFKKCNSDRNCSSLNPSAYANYTGRMELLVDLINPSLMAIKNLVLNENDSYLRMCKDLGIEPRIEDNIPTFDDFKDRPLDIEEELIEEDIKDDDINE